MRGATRPRFALFACLAVVLTLVGCGGGGDDEKVSADEYVSKVCDSVVSWQRDIQSEGEQFGNLLDSAAATGDLEAMRVRIIGFADGVVMETKQMQRQIEAAGEPDVEHGGAIAGELNRAMRGLVAALENVAMQAEQLPLDDENAFFEQAQMLSGAVSRSAESSLTGFAAIQDPELAGAANKDASCRKLQ